MSLARRLAERAAGGGATPRDGGLLTAWRFTRDGVAAEEIVDIEPAESASVRREAAAGLGEMTVPDAPSAAAPAAPVQGEAASSPKVGAPPVEAAPAAHRLAVPGSDVAAPAPAASPMAPASAAAGAAPKAEAAGSARVEPRIGGEVAAPFDRIETVADPAPAQHAAPESFAAAVAPEINAGGDAPAAAEPPSAPMSAAVLVVPAAIAGEPPAFAAAGAVEALPPVFGFEPAAPQPSFRERYETRPRVVVERVDVLVEAPPPPPARAQQAADRARAGARYLTGL
ncbi:MAG: hypothetical protein V4574_06170 [Pseudomonadota bacterium]